MKFGGLALGTTTALTQVLSIVMHERQQWERLLIVVSALEGVTDALLEAARLAQVNNRRGYRRIAATLRTRHLALVEHLPLGPTESQALQADIDRLLFEMLNQLQTIADASYEELPIATLDTLTSVGERLAARILAALIRQNNIRAVAIDAQTLIITDDQFGNATPDLAQSCEHIQRNLLPMLERDIVPVVTGFIGSTPDGRMTTLGRGGSDLTASILAACGGAEELWVWTTVDGMMTTDPNERKDARIIPALSYDEVGEMAYFGARVLHPRMVVPLQETRIPLHIKNVFKPGQTGTLVTEQGDSHRHKPKAVTRIQGLGLTSESSGALANIISMVNNVLVHTAGSPAEVMITAQSSARSFLCFVIPTSSGPDAINTSLDTLHKQFATNPTPIWIAQQVSVISVIGSSINNTPATMTEMLTHLNDLPTLALAQGPSNCSLSVVVKPENAAEALRRMHQYVLNQ